MKIELEKNKQNVIEFYDLMFNKCRPAEAIENYTGDKYIQHNPEVGDGKKAFIEYFIKMAKNIRGKKYILRELLPKGISLYCIVSKSGRVIKITLVLIFSV